MAGAETSTTAAALLTEMWPQDDIVEELFKDKGILPLFPKDTNFYEEKRHIIVGYGTGQGLGPKFTQSRNARGAESQAEMTVTLTSYYSQFSIDRLVKKRGSKRRGSIVNILERKSRNALRAWRRDMNQLLYLDGVGVVARIASSSGISGSTITLATAADHRHFEKGQVFELVTANDGTGTVRSGTLEVSAVTRSKTTSTITTTVAVTTGIPAAANGDYILLREGAHNAVPIGLAGWIPSTDPSSSIYSMSRSPDPQRLGGVRSDATGLSPRESWLLVAADVDDAGPGMPGTAVMNTADWMNLQLELQSAGALTMTKTPSAKIDGINFGIEYDAITYQGPRKRIECVADADCPSGVGYLLELDTWTLASCGPLVEFEREGLQQSDADAEEYMAVGDLALYCEAPGNNGRVTLA